MTMLQYVNTNTVISPRTCPGSAAFRHLLSPHTHTTDGYFFDPQCVSVCLCEVDVVSLHQTDMNVKCANLVVE